MGFLSSLQLGIAVVMFLLVYLFTKILTSRKRAHPLPSGPKPFPSVGNVADLPPVGTLEYKH